MDKVDKANLVNDVIERVRKDIVAKVMSGRIPPEWDGVEMRQYIADSFAREGPIMAPKRKGAYRNTILVSNL